MREIGAYLLSTGSGMALVFGSLQAGKNYYKDRFEDSFGIGVLYSICMVMIGGLAGGLFQFYGYSATKIFRYLVLVAALIVIGRIDRLQEVIPNRILIVLVIIRTVILVLDSMMHLEMVTEILTTAIFGILFGGGVFFIAKLLSPGSIGMGDVKLFSIIGYYMGGFRVFYAIIMSLLIALGYGLAMVARKKLSMKDMVRFGPWIASGTIIILLIGV